MHKAFKLVLHLMCVKLMGLCFVLKLHFFINQGQVLVVCLFNFLYTNHFFPSFFIYPSCRCTKLLTLCCNLMCVKLLCLSLSHVTLFHCVYFSTLAHHIKFIIQFACDVSVFSPVHLHYAITLVMSGFN